MRKATIYFGEVDGPFIEYIEGVTEAGGKRKVKEIFGSEKRISIEFENGDCKDYVGFRYIMDKVEGKK